MNRKKLKKQLRDKIKSSIEELKKYGSEIIAGAILSSFTHQNCNSLETQNFGSFSILAPCGDEEVCGLLFCDRCQVHYLDCYHDQFIGDDDFTFQKQIAPEEAETVKEAILKCENPHDKYCRCEYHEKLGEILYRDFMEFAKQEMQKSGFKWGDKEKTWVEI